MGGIRLSESTAVFIHKDWWKKETYTTQYVLIHYRVLLGFFISIYISLIGWMWIICSYGYFGFFLRLGESYRHHVILKSFVWQKTLTVCFMLFKWPIFIKTARPLLTSLWKHRLAKFSKNLMNLWRFAIKIKGSGNYDFN